MVLMGLRGGGIASVAEERCVFEAQLLMEEQTIDNIAIETLGPMGPQTKMFLLELGWRLRQQTGESRSTSYLLQRISMAIQKGNAVAMMGSLPRVRDLYELLEL